MLLAVGSDNLFWLLGLRDQFGGDNGAYINTATVTVQIQDLAGNNIGSAISLTYAGPSLTVDGKLYADGNYRGQLGSDAALSPGTQYQAVVVVTAQGNTKADLTKVIKVFADYDGVS